MTETDDSEWEDPVDRDNRSYVMSNNYNLSEGMAPRTYTLPYDGTAAGVTLVMREAGPVRTLPVQNNRNNRL